MAFPYVAATEENKALESSLISEFEGTCGSGLGMHDIAVLNTCSLEGERFEKLADIPAVRVNEMGNSCIICLGVHVFCGKYVMVCLIL